MSWLHFTATENYKNRVIQLGEDPSRVFNVGGMGVDSIKKTKLLNKKTLEEKLNFNFGEKNLIITFHSVTLENRTSKKQFVNILTSLNKLKDTKKIFTYSNSNTNSRIINKLITDYVKKNKSTSVAFVSMGRLKYLSTLQFVDGAVGNSSSGILEAPTFKIATVDIGDRQKGRMNSKSIIHCSPTVKSIDAAIAKIYSPEFQKILKKVENPYGEGSSSDKIIKTIKKFSYPNELKKTFHDL